MGQFSEEWKRRRAAEKKAEAPKVPEVVQTVFKPEQGVYIRYLVLKHQGDKTKTIGFGMSELEADIFIASQREKIEVDEFGEMIHTGYSKISETEWRIKRDRL